MIEHSYENFPELYFNSKEQAISYTKLPTGTLNVGRAIGGNSECFENCANVESHKKKVLVLSHWTNISWIQSKSWRVLDNIEVFKKLMSEGFTIYHYNKYGELVKMQKNISRHELVDIRSFSEERQMIPEGVAKDEVFELTDQNLKYLGQEEGPNKQPLDSFELYFDEYRNLYFDVYAGKILGIADFQTLQHHKKILIKDFDDQKDQTLSYAEDQSDSKILNERRNLTSLEIHRNVIDVGNVELMKHLKIMSLINLIIEDDTIKLINCAPNLEELNVFNVKFEEEYNENINELKNLMCLIYHNDHMSDFYLYLKLLSNFLNAAPNLEIIKINYFNTQILDKLSKMQNLRKIICEESILGDIIEISEFESLPNLECIDLKFFKITLDLKIFLPNLKKILCRTNELSKLLEIAPNLEEVHIVSLEEVKEFNLKENSLPNLLEIQAHFDSQSLVSILKAAPNLRKIKCGQSTIKLTEFEPNSLLRLKEADIEFSDQESLNIFLAAAPNLNEVSKNTMQQYVNNNTINKVYNNDNNNKQILTNARSEKFKTVDNQEKHAQLPNAEKNNDNNNKQILKTVDNQEKHAQLPDAQKNNDNNNRQILTNAQSKKFKTVDNQEKPVQLPDAQKIFFAYDSNLQRISEYDPNVTTYRLGVYNNCDWNGKFEGVYNLSKLYKDPVGLKDVKDLSWGEASFATSKNKVNMVGNLKNQILTTEWVALPSLSPNESVTHISVKVGDKELDKNAVEVKYSEEENMYYVRLEPGQGNVVKADITYIVKLPDHEASLESKEEKIVEKLRKKYEGFTTTKLPKNDKIETIEDYIKYCDEKKFGACGDRSVAFMYEAQNLQLNVRYVLSTGHAFIEVYNNKKKEWVTVDLGGMPAEQTINNNNEPVDNLKKEIEQYQKRELEIKKEKEKEKEKENVKELWRNRNSKEIANRHIVK